MVSFAVAAREIRTDRRRFEDPLHGLTASLRFAISTTYEAPRPARTRGLVIHPLPDWLREARRSAAVGDASRALDLLETYACRPQYRDARSAALRLAEGILRVPRRTGADNMKARATAVAKRLGSANGTGRGAAAPSRRKVLVPAASHQPEGLRIRHGSVSWPSPLVLLEERLAELEAKREAELEAELEADDLPDTGAWEADDGVAADAWALTVEAVEQARAAEAAELDLLAEVARREKAATEAELAKARAEQVAAAARRRARAEAAAAEKRARAEAAAAKRRAAKKAAADRRAARQNKRARSLLELGLSKERAEALALLRSGPYDVVLKGVRSSHNPDEVGAVLQELGYRKRQAHNVILRSAYIAPEIVAVRVHESDAIRLRVALESAGARVRIQPHAVAV